MTSTIIPIMRVRDGVEPHALIPNNDGVEPHAVITNNLTLDPKESRS